MQKNPARVDSGRASRAGTRRSLQRRNAGFTRRAPRASANSAKHAGSSQMPDAASLPEDLLMQAAIERLADGDSDHEAPFDPVDGLNLVIGPGSVEPTAGLLAAARRHSPQTFFHATGL